MASNRIYSPIRCKGCGGKFPPHDRRQKYCEQQCRRNYNNDKRRTQNSGRYHVEGTLRACDQLLEALYNSPLYREEQIGEAILKNLGLDFTTGTLEENLDTLRPIRWYHAYGVELVDKVRRIYTIHYRTNFLA